MKPRCASPDTIAPTFRNRLTKTFSGYGEGIVAKIFYENLDYADVVTYAILDFKKNGHDYYKDFISN
jgi:hypothetical protein